MLDIKELEREFNEAYGQIEENEYVPTTEEERQMAVDNARLAAILNDVIDECSYTLTAEASSHFLADYSKDIEDDGRYFCNRKELKDFIQYFVSKGGNIDDLHCGKVYTDSGNFVSYEVVRQRYWDIHPELFFAEKDFDLKEVV